MFTAILFMIPAIVLVATVLYSVRLVSGGKLTAKTAVIRQIVAVLAVGILCCVCAMTTPAAEVPNTADQAVSTAAEAAGNQDGLARGMGYLAAAIVTGLSGIGGGIAVAAGAPAAIGATAEDPKAFGKALIFVALGEGIALYGLLVSILILNKV